MHGAWQAHFVRTRHGYVRQAAGSGKLNDNQRQMQVVFEEGIDRKVIFSSFDPDVATLARLKQPRYPVRPSARVVQLPA